MKFRCRVWGKDMWLGLGFEGQSDDSGVKVWRFYSGLGPSVTLSAFLDIKLVSGMWGPEVYLGLRVTLKV